jgi:hypothetical protein
VTSLRSPSICAFGREDLFREVLRGVGLRRGQAGRRRRAGARPRSSPAPPRTQDRARVAGHTRCRTCGSARRQPSGQDQATAVASRTPRRTCCPGIAMPASGTTPSPFHRGSSCNLEVFVIGESSEQCPAPAVSFRVAGDLDMAPARHPTGNRERAVARLWKPKRHTRSAANGRWQARQERENTPSGNDPQLIGPADASSELAECERDLEARAVWHGPARASRIRSLPPLCVPWRAAGLRRETGGGETSGSTRPHL